ncbi:MAG: hypothetical protein ABH879_01625 [archaeon]
MGDSNYFESMDYLEPRCPGCNVILDYGVNTSFNDKLDVHVCNKCGKVLK